MISLLMRYFSHTNTLVGHLIDVRGAFPTYAGSMKFFANKILLETGCFLALMILKNNGEGDCWNNFIFTKISDAIRDMMLDNHLALFYPKEV
jgi:hypothetical protein